jgi:ribonuclease P protein component
MLSKKNRLQKDKDFAKVFKASRPAYFGKLAVRAKENGGKPTRFGFVISNKIDKRSTRRNALKRRLRAIVRELILEIRSGYDVVVIVKENYPWPYDYAKIKQDLVEGLKKTYIFKS